MTLKESIIFLRNEGRTYSEIAYVLMCSKGTIAHHIGKGQKAKTKARQDSNRSKIRKWLRDTKEASSCRDCGRYYKYYQMEFDHLPEFEKLFNLAAFKEYTSSLDVVKAEVDKCEIVCANCHAERTHLRRIIGSDWDDDIIEAELG